MANTKKQSSASKAKVSASTTETKVDAAPVAAVPAVAAPAPVVAAPAVAAPAPAVVAAADPAPASQPSVDSQVGGKRKAKKASKKAPAKKSSKKGKGKGKKAAARVAKPKVAAPVAAEPKVAASNEEAEEGEGKSRSRFFKLVFNGEESGRFSGNKPKQAANKALTAIIKKEGANGTNKQFTFKIKECTRGSKQKVYCYTGERIQLEKPMQVTIGKSENGKEPKIIEYKFTNKVKKLKDITTA